MKKKVMAVVLAGIMVLTAACGSKSPSEDSASQAVSEEEAGQADTQEETDTEEVIESEKTVLEDGKTYHIGIVLQNDHGAYARMAEGFTEEINTLLQGDVTVTVQDAGGDDHQMARIVTDYIAEERDVIVAGGYGALRTAADATDSIPVLGTCVSDYISTGTVDSNDEPGGNVSGVNDVVDMNRLYEMIKDINLNDENAQGEIRLGVIYTDGDPSCEYEYQLLKLVAEEDAQVNGTALTLEKYLCSEEEPMETVLEKACSECNVLFLPPDAEIATKMDQFREITVSHSIPVVTTDSYLCRAGTYACLSVDYLVEGKIAAQMAYEILTEEEDENPVAQMSIRTAIETENRLGNPGVAEAIGRPLLYYMDPLTDDAADASTGQAAVEEYGDGTDSYEDGTDSYEDSTESYNSYGEDQDNGYEEESGEDGAYDQAGEQDESY